MNNEIKIAIIGIVGVPAKYGGFETLVEHLLDYIDEKYNMTVYCSSKEYDKKLKTYKNANLSYLNFKANGIQSVIYDSLSIFEALRFADSILILGVSGCIVLPLVKRISKTKVIVNIDGLEWKRDKWSFLPKKFLKLSEKLAVNYADEIIADNEVIKEYILTEYNKKSNLIAYGADHAFKVELSNELIEKYDFLRGKYAFKVCRIEPENNIHIVLEAFKNFKNLNLVIIGNWENSNYGKELFNTYNEISNIFLLSPIYNQNILNALRSNSYVYVHGHSAGGTNPSLVEAMYLGLPIICYNINYNQRTTGNKSLYFNNEKDLEEILLNIDNLDLDQISKDMLEIAKKDYLWQKISKRYQELF